MRAVLLMAALAFAPAMTAGAQSPYAGEEEREIKALSAEQIRQYLGGAGMGYAKAAELNAYPGPKHVLDLAEELGLDDEQLARTRDIHAAMHRAAVALGAQLVDRERRLDRAFAQRVVTADSLAELVAEIAHLDGQLRVIHLNAHLEQTEVLTPDQRDLYDRLRGYAQIRHAGHEH